MLGIQIKDTFFFYLSQIVTNCHKSHPMSVSPLFKKCWSEKYKKFWYDNVRITMNSDNETELGRLESELKKHSPEIPDLVNSIIDLFEVICKGEDILIQLDRIKIPAFEKKINKLLKEFPNTENTVTAILDLFQIDRRYRHFTSEEIINEAVSIFNSKHRPIKFIQENDCQPFRKLIESCLNTYNDGRSHAETKEKFNFFKQKNLTKYFIKEISKEAKKNKILESGKLRDYTKLGLASYLCCMLIGIKLPEELSPKKLMRKGSEAIK